MTGEFTRLIMKRDVKEQEQKKTTTDVTLNTHVTSNVTSTKKVNVNEFLQKQPILIFFLKP